MTRRLATLTALLLSITPVYADGEIRVRAFVEPEGEIFVGQQVRLNIEVQTDTWFTTAPRYPELKLPGAIALMPDAFGVNSTTREGETTWAGQTRRFVLFPQRSGALTIPPIDISLAVASNGKAGPSITVTSPAVVIPILAPPGSTSASEFVTTAGYRIDSDWDNSLDDLRVGDSISLTVTQSAEDVFALTIPAIAFPDIEGLARYTSQPELIDNNNRGQYSGVRTDHVTYVLQAEGEFTIPEISTSWFDLDDRTMRKASVEETPITVAANPDALLGIGTEADDSEDWAILARTTLDWLAANIQWITLIIGVIYLGIRWVKSILLPAVSRWRARRQAWKHSEEAYYRKLQSALRSGDPDRAVASFWRWSDRLPDRGVPLSLDRLKIAAAESTFDVGWTNLEAARYLQSDAGLQRKAIGRLRKSVGALRTSWFTVRSRIVSANSDIASSHKLNPWSGD